MNSHQRRKFIRSDKNSMEKRAETVLNNFERWAGKHCEECAKMSATDDFMLGDASHAHILPHFEDWVRTQGDVNLSLVVNYAELEGVERSNELLMMASKELERRAEEELLKPESKRDEKRYETLKRR